MTPNLVSRRGGAIGKGVRIKKSRGGDKIAKTLGKKRA